MTQAAHTPRPYKGGADITDIEAVMREPAPVGDLNSDARGSGARFNAGKAPFDLVPLGVLGRSMLTEHADSAPARAMIMLGAFQSTRNTHFLYAILQELGARSGWEECARVFEWGAKKYAPRNWCKGMPWSVPVACIARHLLALIDGEAIDAESSLPHRGAVFCNVAMLLTFGTT